MINFNQNIMVADRIRTNRYRVYNKELAHYIGLREAIYLSYLVDQDFYFNEMEVGKPFYKTQKQIYLETTIKADTQTTINKKLQRMAILKIVKQGLPARNYFEINYNNLNILLNEATEDFIKMIKKEEELLEEKEQASSGKNQELELGKIRNINNKYKNNKKANITNNNKLLFTTLGEPENSPEKEEENMENKNNELFEELNVDGMCDFSKSEEVTKQTSTPASPPKKKKGGLAPLIDEIENYFSKDKYPVINQKLNVYLHCYIGCRKLPSLEKWQGMLQSLIDYSSINLPAALGKKVNVAIATEIIDKATEGKDGAPFMEFDDIYHNKEKNIVKEPQFNLNQEFEKY